MKKAFLSVVSALMLLFLGTGATFTVQAAAVREYKLKATFSAVEKDNVQWPTIYVDLTGAGNSTFLGLYTEQMQAVVQNNPQGVGIATASGRFIAADQDVLYIKGTGVGVPSGTPGINKIVEKYNIMGGTGRFVGASGNITIERWLNLSNGVSSGSMWGTVVLP